MKEGPRPWQYFGSSRFAISSTPSCGRDARTTLALAFPMLPVTVAIAIADHCR
jgi:hypothetical protein